MKHRVPKEIKDRDVVTPGRRHFSKIMNMEYHRVLGTIRTCLSKKEYPEALRHSRLGLARFEAPEWVEMQLMHVQVLMKNGFCEEALTCLYDLEIFFHGQLRRGDDVSFELSTIQTWIRRCARDLQT